MNLYQQVQAEIKREMELREREENLKKKEKEIEEKIKAASENNKSNYVNYSEMSDAEYYTATYKK